MAPVTTEIVCIAYAHRDGIRARKTTAPRAWASGRHINPSRVFVFSSCTQPRSLNSRSASYGNESLLAGPGSGPGSDGVRVELLACCTWPCEIPLPYPKKHHTLPTHSAFLGNSRRRDDPRVTSWNDGVDKKEVDFGTLASCGLDDSIFPPPHVVQRDSRT